MFNLTEVEQSTKPSCHNAIYNDSTQHASCSEIGRVTSHRSSKNTPIIDLTMGEDIIVVPRSAPHPHHQIVSSEMLGPNSPEPFADLLKSWYTERNSLEPPPCAVDVRVRNNINTWKTAQQVFWSYMGVEEMTVRSYELEGFQHQRDRFIIVAQGLTKGPFIIKCLQINKRYRPPVSYHIWKGLDNANSHDQVNCFEQTPSVFKCVKSQNDKSGFTLTAINGPLQTITYHTSPYSPLAEPPYLPHDLTTTLSPGEPRNVPSTGRSPELYNSPSLTRDQEEHRKQECPTKALIFCQRVLHEMMDQKHSRLNQPFLQPVDPVTWNAPTYFQVIKHPMDLSTIQQKLAAGDYKDAEEFVKDMCLMFNNCKRFNWESDPVYKSGQLLNELFAELWAKRKSLAQDSQRNQEVNAPVRCKIFDLNGVRGTRPTIEPFTPPTMSAASPIEEDVTEVFQPLSPLGKETSRAQILEEVAETQCASQSCHSPAPRTRQGSRDAFISGDDQHLADFSGQRSRNLSAQSSDSMYQPSITDLCSQMRATSPGLSEENGETLRFSREASYTSEMHVEAEREFFLSQFMHCSAVAHSDDRIHNCSSPSCKRKRENTKGNTDEVTENTSAKKSVTLLASQTPCQTISQNVWQETRQQILGDNPPITTLRGQSAPSKKTYEHCDKMCGNRSSFDASSKGKTPQTNQPSIDPITANNSLLQRSGMSPMQQIPSRLVLSGVSECTHGLCVEPTKDTTEPEGHLSLNPSATPIPRSSLRLRCNYRNWCRKTFKYKTNLTRHVKTVRDSKHHCRILTNLCQVHLRRRNKLCPICGRRFGRGDALARWVSMSFLRSMVTDIL